MLCIIFKNKNPLCYFLLQKKEKLMNYWFFEVFRSRFDIRARERRNKVLRRRRSIRGRCEDDTKIREKDSSCRHLSAPFIRLNSLELKIASVTCVHEIECKKNHHHHHHCAFRDVCCLHHYVKKNRKNVHF